MKTKTEHRISSAYHPQTNGLVERFNQTLQRSLVKLVNDNQTDWDEKIDEVLFAYRVAPHKSTKVSPFELMYCRYVHICITYMYIIRYSLCIYAFNLGKQSCQLKLIWEEVGTQKGACLILKKRWNPTLRSFIRFETIFLKVPRKA